MGLILPAPPPPPCASTALSKHQDQRQGLVLWVALKAQWSLRCEARFEGAVPTLDDFGAVGGGIGGLAGRKNNFSLSRVDLQHLIEQLFSWFTGGMFIQKAPAARVYPAKPTAMPGDLKEQKWG